MRGLKAFLKDKRYDLIEEALNLQKTREEMGIPVVKRSVRRKKIMPGEKAADEPLTLDQELKRSMFECIGRFQQEIDTCCESMESVSDRFAILELSNLIETSETELPKFVQSLFENYNELSADGILTEIPRLRRFLKPPKFQKKILLVGLP
ncbi:hypothetical protein AVEN_14043-1 [Araneus ventricosus]|uniref:Uncharacterized protein n=1 Tax=Araneus ventricosus TaxID=182803 RepID=A0A4Y2KRK9_ARAVE|nr:hypothetical protein AVEN_14043-1 [Araneus ventricosus]